MLRDKDATFVLHFADRVGGIGANRAYPAEFFSDNILMGVNLFYEPWRRSVGGFVDAELRHTRCVVSHAEDDEAGTQG